MSLQPIAAYLPLAQVQPSKTNPRKTFNTHGLDELATSIKKYGVAQPILVRPMPDCTTEVQTYEIIAGERRYRASGIAGMETIPARILEVDDLTMLELQVIENLQREDLHPLEEAESYEALIKSHGKLADYGVDDIAAKLGKSRAYIYARMKLCALGDKARAAFYDGDLNASTALLLARIPVTELQEKALTDITEERHSGPMSVREAQRHIQRTYMLHLVSAKFTITDGTLVPAAGSCMDCLKRTGANLDLFRDVGSADVCTDPICFDTKKAAHTERIKASALESGKKIITGAAAKKLKPNQWERPKGLVTPGQRYWPTESDKPLSELLGDSMPDTVLFEDPHTGELQEVILEDQVRQALQKNGHKLSRAQSEYSAKNNAEANAAKTERTYRRALLEATHDAVGMHLASGQTLGIDDLRMITTQAYARTANDIRPPLAGLWGWDAKDTSTAFAIIKHLSPNDLALLLLDITLASDTYVNTWNTDAKPENLESAAQRYGVDKKQVKREANPKEQAPQPTETEVKYRCPQTGSTWTGRGKKPRWVELYEESGQHLDALLTTPVEEPEAA